VSEGTGRRKAAASWPKRCSCGRSWTVATWRGLELVGPWIVDEFRLELRTCTCGSTITVPLSLLQCE
jgi:hypothetical protein